MALSYLSLEAPFNAPGKAYRATFQQAADVQFMLSSFKRVWGSNIEEEVEKESSCGNAKTPDCCRQVCANGGSRFF